MTEREQHLDQQFLRTSSELEAKQAEIAVTERERDAAKSKMETARREAAEYMVNAFIGAGDSAQLPLGAAEPNVALHQMVLLETLRGSREDVSDSLRAAQADLTHWSEELDQATQQLRSGMEDQRRIKSELESSITRQREILDQTNGELRAAIEAEQQRRAAEAEARVRAQIEAHAAAARQQQAQQSAAAARTRTGPTAQTTPLTTSAATAPAPAPATRPPAAPAAPPVAPVAPSSPAPPVPASNPGAAAAVSAALSQVGVPYRWGGTSPSTGFDCSGLTQWAFRQAGVNISRTTYTQWADTVRISPDQLQPGDLVFFSGLGHMGMYIGNGMMVHAPRTGDVVKVSPVFRGGGSYMGAGRLR